MIEESSIETSAQKLIDTRLSLSEILGNNWKNECIFPSVEAALKDEGIKSLDEGEEIFPSEARTDLERFVVYANEIFRKKGSIFKAKLISSEGINHEKNHRKILIEGNIGKAYFLPNHKQCQHHH